MNTYTRRRGTQEAAGSESGGGGQSERRPSFQREEWRWGTPCVCVCARACMIASLRYAYATVSLTVLSQLLVAHACYVRQNEPTPTLLSLPAGKRRVTFRNYHRREDARKDPSLRREVVLIPTL